MCDVQKKMCGEDYPLNCSDIHIPISIIGMPIIQPPQRLMIRPPKTKIGQKYPHRKARIIERIIAWQIIISR